MGEKSFMRKIPLSRKKANFFQGPSLENRQFTTQNLREFQELRGGHGIPQYEGVEWDRKQNN